MLASPEVEVIGVANKLEAILSGPDNGYESSIDEE